MGCCNKPINIVTGHVNKLLNINAELQRDRMRICNNCVNKRGNGCTICGCDLDAKTRVPGEYCPIKKWLSV